MRLHRIQRCCIGLLIVMCCYTWWLSRQHASVTHEVCLPVGLGLPLTKLKITPRPTLLQIGLHRELDSVFSFPAELTDKTPGNGIDLSWSVGASNEKRREVILSPKRVYEWNETVVFQGILPLIENVNKGTGSNQQRIIFNRVGKCGSRSVLDIFRTLAERNKFNMIESSVYTQKILPSEKEEMMAQVLTQIKSPYLFQRHMYHINFTYYGLQSPSYINIIRDPIARFTSNYYYRRFGDGFQERTWVFNGTEGDKYRTINECVLQNRYECSKRKLFYILPFFCGNDPRCKYPTEWTLFRAMANVRKDFVVIGLLEELTNMFVILEKLWPKMFRGCVDMLENPSEGQLVNRTAALTRAKEKPSSNVIAILKENMDLEYRFYRFVKKRFHSLKQKFRIPV